MYVDTLSELYITHAPNETKDKIQCLGRCCIHPSLDPAQVCSRQNMEFNIVPPFAATHCNLVIVHSRSHFVCLFIHSRCGEGISHLVNV